MTLTLDKQTGYQLQRAPFQKLQNNNFLNIEKKTTCTLCASGPAVLGINPGASGPFEANK